ncbi:MAG: energy transducer TonB [Bryobacteraceae bacterium]
MSARTDWFEQREPLGAWLAASLAAHAAVFVTLFVYQALGERGRVLWGTPHALGGGSVAVTPVRQIPLPARSGRVNPVAEDTQSRVPAPPKPPPQKAKAPPKEAIEIPARKSEKTKPEVARRRPVERPWVEDRPHQLYSQSGQALSSPLFGAQTGAGGVGMGPGSAFGQRYGWYRDLIETRVAQKWDTSEVDPRITTAPPVIVTFDILRNGQVRNVTIVQSSGNRALDYSAQRAIYLASPFPPLPAGFERDEARVEIWFQLKR